MFSSNFTKKEKTGLAIALTFLFVVFADWLVVRPINKKLNLLDHSITVSRSQLELDLANVSQKSEITEEYEKYATYQQTFPSDEEEITVLLSSLEDLGRDAGVTLLDMKPQQTNTADLYKKYNISIELEGNVDQLISFLYHLNKSEHLIRVQQLNFSSRDKKTNLIKGSISVTKVFVL